MPDMELCEDASGGQDRSWSPPGRRGPDLADLPTLS